MGRRRWGCAVPALWLANALCLQVGTRGASVFGGITKGVRALNRDDSWLSRVGLAGSAGEAGGLHPPGGLSGAAWAARGIC